MKHINIHFSNIIPYEFDDIEITYDKRDTPQVSLKMEKTYKKLDVSFFDGLILNDVTHSFNVAFENINPDLPVILLFRDSFADEGFIIKYVAQHFSKTIMIHWTNMGYLETFINSYNPDIVIIESIDREMVFFYNTIIQIPELP
jgi:hypothetical protein